MAFAVRGAAVFLGVLLIFTGLLKVRAPDVLGGPLMNVLPKRLWRVPALSPRRLALTLCLAEIALGVTLLVPSTVMSSSVAVVALTLGFLGFAIAARIRGSSCGCFGSVSRKPVGVVDICRNGGLAAVAIVVASHGGQLKHLYADGNLVSVVAVAFGLLVLFFGVTMISYHLTAGPAAVAPPGSNMVDYSFGVRRNSRRRARPSHKDHSQGRR